MIIIRKSKIIFTILFIAITVIAVSAYSGKSIKTFSEKNKKIVVIDAGHGFPDGGAVGMNGTIESTLNIDIAKRVEKALKKKGYKVIMTRNDENAVLNVGKTMRQRKRNDMNKRLEIINNSNAEAFISIHMNKFTDSRYRGAQVIFSSNFEESEFLAQEIQKTLHDVHDNTSKRTYLRAPDSIFLLKNAQIPAVIVECGFLSNFEEERLLNTQEYRKELAKAIVDGILNYYQIK